MTMHIAGRLIDANAAALGRASRSVSTVFGGIVALSTVDMVPGELGLQPSFSQDLLRIE
jgi:hypothetical protein